MGHTLELHYCQGRVTDFSLIGHAECVCESSHKINETVTTDSDCQNHCHTEPSQDEKSYSDLSEKGCCKTEKLTLLSPSIKAHSNTEISIQAVIVDVFNPTFFVHPIAESNENCFGYITPIFSRDITLLTHSYLI